MSEALLKVSGLTMRFGGLLAVDSVGFEVQRDEVFAIIGPNGAGKTTVFNCVGGFYKPTAGDIVMDGKSIAGQPSHKVARHGLVRTFQISSLFAQLTVFENVYIAVAQAAGRAAERSTPMARQVAVGACIFMASDTLIAINKFLTPVPQAGLVIMLSYYLAQWLLWRGALREPKEICP